MADVPAVVAGDRAFSLSPEERDRLKRWLELGGFLLIDNTGASGPGAARHSGAGNG